MNKCYYNNKKIQVNNELLELKERLKFFLDKKQIPTLYQKIPLSLTYTWFEERRLFYKEIPYLSTNNLNALLNMLQKEQLLNAISRLEKMYTPFKIPIIYEEKNKDYGEFVPLYLGEDIYNLKLIFTEFRLSNREYILKPLIYAHELTHSILEGNQNSINNYINYELLPISIEYLMAMDIGKNIFEICYLKRLKDLLKYIEMLEKTQLNEIEKIKISSYINSILITNEIIKRYSKEKNIRRNILFEKINKILKDDQSIENFLIKESISYTPSLENMIKLLKKEEMYVSL